MFRRKPARRTLRGARATKDQLEEIVADESLALIDHQVFE